LLIRKLKHAQDYWKNGGHRLVARVMANNLVEWIYPVVPRTTYMSIRMLVRLGYWPNIHNPRSLNEKVVHRELFAQHPLASLVADKWRVRQYVAERGLGDILTEVYFDSDDPEKIPFDDLPDQFVIKANHGRDWNILVTDKRTLDRQAVIKQCREWLNLRYGKVTRNYELHYDSIPPRILVERFLRDEKYERPLDYKVDCFHGKALYIGVKCNETRPIYSRFDRNWSQVRFAKTGRYRTDVPFPRPALLERILDVAERLSSEIDYCRVDLYLVNDKELRFGEITMTPAGGQNPISREWDFRLGALW
jgi:hypothetical protein